MIFRRIQYLIKHSFVQRVATLQVGIFFGNFLQAAAGVVLARLLQPERYGIYVLAFGLAGLVSILLGAGMQDAIASLVGGAKARNDKEEIRDGFAFLFKMAVITGLIVVAFLPFLGRIAQHFYGDAHIGLYAGIVIAGSILSTFAFSFAQIALQVNHRIKLLTGVIIADQIFRYGLAIILVLAGYGILGAMIGQIMGALIMLGISIGIWHFLVTRHDLPPAREVLTHAFRVPLKKYLGFSFWVALDRNIATLYLTLPVMLTGAYVIATQVSYFKLAFGFVNLALSLLGPISVLLNVEFPKMKLEQAAKLRSNFIKVSWYSVGLSLLLTGAAIVVSPIAFRILYGNTYLPSIPYITGLLVYGGLFGIGVGLGPMWRALNYVKMSIIINLVVLGLGIPMGIIFLKTWGLWGAVAMVTVWFTVSHFVSFFAILHRMRLIEKTGAEV